MGESEDENGGEGALNGRVCVVAGAGRGLRRAAATELAAHGATVVVTDLGTSFSGEGEDPTPTTEGAAAIRDAGRRRELRVRRFRRRLRYVYDDAPFHRRKPTRPASTPTTFGRWRTCARCHHLHGRTPGRAGGRETL